MVPASRGREEFSQQARRSANAAAGHRVSATRSGRRLRTNAMSSIAASSRPTGSCHYLRGAMAFRSCRTMGRAGGRRATVLKPALADVEA